MKHGSLFSGIGGFDLAASWLGWDNVFHCEILEYNQKILKQHWPKAECFTDITKASFTKYANTIDVLTGGFPCQDISTSGRGAGIEGEKSGLWNEYKRAIKETNCNYIVAENSPNLINKGIEKILLDLSEMGYNAEWGCLRASSFGAYHERERCYVVAYSNSYGFQGILQRLGQGSSLLPKPSDKIILSSLPKSFEQLGDYKRIRETDGVPNQSHRIKACGNAVVPQVIVQIFKAINDAESERNVWRGQKTNT